VSSTLVVLVIVSGPIADCFAGGAASNAISP
jgi:hypothetical protein